MATIIGPILENKSNIKKKRIFGGRDNLVWVGIAFLWVWVWPDTSRIHFLICLVLFPYLPSPFVLFPLFNLYFLIKCVINWIFFSSFPLNGGRRDFSFGGFSVQMFTFKGKSHHNKRGNYKSKEIFFYLKKRKYFHWVSFSIYNERGTLFNLMNFNLFQQINLFLPIKRDEFSFIYLFKVNNEVNTKMIILLICEWNESY